jgi:hypothetical protein
LTIHLNPATTELWHYVYTKVYSVHLRRQAGRRTNSLLLVGHRQLVSQETSRAKPDALFYANR